MKVQNITIGKITPYEKNPRRNQNAVEKVANSIKSFGFNVPIIVDKDMVVIAGHTRLLAAKSLGIETVPVHVASHLTPDQCKAYRIADNKTAEYAEWDMDLLAQEILDLQGVNFDLADLGFEDAELASIIGNELNNIDESTIDHIPDKPDDPITKRGDLVCLGNHRLLCGDSTCAADIRKLLDGITADVIVFDPPYEITSLYDWIPKASDTQKLCVMWDMYRFGIAPHKAILAGWKPQYEFIWDCVTSWYVPNRPLARHKVCGVFGVDPKFIFEKAIIKDGKKRESKIVHNTRGEMNYEPLDGAVHIRTVEQFPTTSEDGGHAHSKPCAWIEAIFNGIGGEIYFDMFGGSGTTAIVCEKIGKKSLTMELDPANCDVIIQRWENATNKKAERCPAT